MPTRPVKRRFVAVFYEPRGHRECGGVFVQLECQHVVVVQPRGRLDTTHECWRCTELARVRVMLDDYFKR